MKNAACRGGIIVVMLVIVVLAGRTFGGGISRRAITLNVGVSPFRSEDLLLY